MDEEMKKILDEHEKRLSKLEVIFATKPEGVQKRLSPKEFVLTKNPKDDVQKTLALGYYLEKYQDLSAFNLRDLEDAFRVAKESVPDNINYKVLRNIEKGHMMEAKEKKDALKAWTLTASGERFVESSFT